MKTGDLVTVKHQRDVFFNASVTTMGIIIETKSVESIESETPCVMIPLYRVHWFLSDGSFPGKAWYDKEQLRIAK